MADEVLRTDLALRRAGRCRSLAAPRAVWVLRSALRTSQMMFVDLAGRETISM
jgi:hypothetical protein